MKNNKGFTLAELLIVVAIIAVLVAIAIPVFRGQLSRAEAAADQANCRSLYAELQVSYLESGYDSSKNVSGTAITVGGQAYTLKRGTVSVTGTDANGYKVVYDCTINDYDSTWGN